MCEYIAIGIYIWSGLTNYYVMGLDNNFDDKPVLIPLSIFWPVILIVGLSLKFWEKYDA